MRVKAGSCGHCSAGNGLNNRQNHSPVCVTHLTAPYQLLATAPAAGSATSQKSTEVSWAAIATKQPLRRNSHRNQTAIATKQPLRRTASTANSHACETKTAGQPRPQDNPDRGTATAAVD